MKFRVLVIPGGLDQGLNIAEEMLRLANLGNNSDHLYVETITPQRSKEIDIVDLLRGSKFDCLHFLGHSDGETFVLASGDVLSEDKILALCRDAGAKCLFFNSCSSAAICQYAVNTTVAIALAWVGPVLDNDAIVGAIRFYSAISGYGEPWGSGLRRAYESVGEKRRLLWLTDGEYVSNMIAPIISRLDRFDQERKDAFSLFGGKLESIIEKINSVSSSVSSGLAKVTESYSRIRIVLYAVAAALVATIIFLGYTFIAQAQTIPPTPLPGCGASGGQPKKCNTPTMIPTDPPTSAPTDPPRSTDTPEPPTSAPTDPPRSTDTPEPPTSAPTDPPRPTDTPEPPTSTPRPTHTKTPRPTETPTIIIELPTITPEPPTPTKELPPCQ